MELQPAPIPIVFRGGIDTLTDPKSVLPTMLTRLENAVFTKGTTLSKRTGYAALSAAVDGGTTLGQGRALASRGDELLSFADDTLYSYRESSGTWSRVGSAISAVHTERSIAKTGTNQTMADTATAGGVRVAAWEDNLGGVWWSVHESIGDRTLRSPEQLAVGATSPRVIHNGDGIHIYYLDTGGGRIMAAVINPADYTAAVVPIVVTADLSIALPFYDVQRYTASGVASHPAVMVWNDNGTGGFRVGYIDSSGALIASPAVASWAGPSNGPLSISCVDATTPYGGDVVGIAYLDTDVNVKIVDATNLGSVVFDVVSVVRLTAVRLASTFTTDGVANVDQTTVTMVVWAEGAGAIDRDALVGVGSVGPSGLAGPTTILRGHGLVSRGFTEGLGPVGDDEAAFLRTQAPSVMVVHAVDFFPYVACVRVTNVETAPSFGGGVARLLVGLSDGLPRRRHLAAVEQDEDDPRIWRWPGIARGMRSASRGVAQFLETGIQLVTIDFDSAEAYQHAEFGRDLIVAGAMPLRYDGRSIAELGFHTAPDDCAAIVESTAHDATEMASDGTYIYAYNYEEVDASGEVHPGPMSIPYTAVLGPGGTGTIHTIPTYRLTGKARIRIAVWRSTRNGAPGADGSLPLMYRVTSLDPSATTGANRYIVNDTTTDTATFLDEMPDATLLTRENAYTNGGTLSNDPAGMGHIMVAAKNRLFFNDPTDPELVRFTQTRRDGYGPEFAAGLPTSRVLGGTITALGLLDSALLIFTDDTVEFMDGDGPLQNPSLAPQIGFTAPRLITGDVGCPSARSLAVTPDRVMFQSKIGIYQIDRSQQVAFIGAPVAAYKTSNVVSADAIPGETRILFLIDHEDGLALQYDYFRGQWSVFTNHGGLDGVVVRDTYHYMRSNTVDGRVFQADSTTYLDAGVDVRMLIETAEIKVAEYHQGLQKIWYALFLGEYKSPHQLRIRFATDYRPGWAGNQDLNVDANFGPAFYGSGPYGAGPYGGASNTLYQRRIHCSLKCQSMRVQISDIANGAPLGASFELTEMLLTAGVMRTSNVFGSSRTN